MVWGQESKQSALCFEKTPLVAGAGRSLGCHLRNTVIIEAADDENLSEGRAGGDGEERIQVKPCGKWD